MGLFLSSGMCSVSVEYPLSLESAKHTTADVELSHEMVPMLLDSLDADAEFRLGRVTPYSQPLAHRVPCSQ